MYTYLDAYLSTYNYSYIFIYTPEVSALSVLRSQGHSERKFRSLTNVMWWP